MLERLFAELGPWNWIVLGLLLMILEVTAPGIFFLWFGIAALIVGGFVILLGEAFPFGWQVQVILFLVLSLIAVFIGRKLVGATDAESDEPLLNRRGEQLIGQIVTLEEATVNGRGRARVGDSLWRVTGPDLAAGTPVKIVGIDQGTLRVEAL
ncbi:membrane protein implicated in regulation of membrane protease activity [Phyllobacterium ifriqiyense]|uniref:Membrane protein implicated in regulation of membrane protease activity n=1 Tax=Phyllobacterium ifriqiyense TaxID=314238 RepID=A0ABU0S7M9_9HYPH|nr:NfeD family protein [Phyllobacterium ifriqiyense]MDQ0996769.1 membrane protein implicated in regulation of membrane protease activity [Phyllobacterium ifriqiyense]